MQRLQHSRPRPTVGVWRWLPALVCVLLLGACRQPDSGDAAAAFKLVEGKPFPPVKLAAGSGTPVGIESLRGRMVVLNVWATWCPPCRKEMPDLERLSHTLDSQRYAVIGLSTDRDRWLAEEFLLRNNITFKNYFDADGSIARRLQLAVYPETFLIAPDGVLILRVPGLRDWSSPEIVAAIEFAYAEWQAGQAPDMSRMQ